jgi:hypothetical protein
MQIECYYIIGFTVRWTDNGKTKLYKLHITQIIIVNRMVSRDIHKRSKLVIITVNVLIILPLIH